MLLEGEPGVSAVPLWLPWRVAGYGHRELQPAWIAAVGTPGRQGLTVLTRVPGSLQFAAITLCWY